MILELLETKPDGPVMERYDADVPELAAAARQVRSRVPLTELRRVDVQTALPMLSRHIE